MNGTATIFHYNLSGQIIAELDNAGTVTAEYVYLNDQPLAKIEGSNAYYYHNDHLATSSRRTDSFGVSSLSKLHVAFFALVEKLTFQTWEV